MSKTIKNQEIPDGYVIWHCVLCGCFAGAYQKTETIIGACCCPNCGMTCLRPIKKESK